MPKHSLIPALLFLAIASGPANPARPDMPLGHHGGLITHCTDPVFSGESPGPEDRVGKLETFSFTASDNTEPDSLEAWVNLQPAKLTITPLRSGQLRVEATPAAPVTQGRAWIKVKGMSRDGCDQLHTWNVHTGEP